MLTQTLGRLAMVLVPGLLAGCASDPQPAKPATDSPQSQATQVGYIVNLDFEAGLTGKGKVDGWGGGGDGYERGLENQTQRTGKYSARIRRTAPGGSAEKDFASFTQCIEPVHFRGKRVRYSGELKTADAGWAGLWLRVDGPDGRPLAFDNMSERGPRGTIDWARYELVLDVPAEATGICIGWLLGGSGTAWADNLKVEIVDASTPVTGH